MAGYFYLRILSAVAILILCELPSLCSEPTIIVLSTLNSVEVKLTSTAGYHAGTDLNYEMKHWPDGSMFTQGRAESARITTDKSGLQSFRITDLSPKPWSPQDPQLYTVTVSDTSRKRIGQARFGFRVFEVKNRRFYLNGRPIFLRGFPINPPGRDLPETAGKDPEFARGYIRLIKSAGANIIRTDTDVWLDACDELGMLVFAGRYGPAFGGDGRRVPADYEQTRARYRAMFSELANHASIVIYVLTNEVDYKQTGYEDFLHMIREDIRLFDPTRPVLGNAGFGRGKPGEIFDLHPYHGWYSSNIQDWYHVFRRYLDMADKADQPLTFTECVGAYTSDSGEFLTMSKQMPTMLRWIGTSEDPRDAALDYQAELVKQIIEIGRRIRTEKSAVSGIMPFTYFLGWTKAQKVEDLTTKPAFSALKTAFQPVLISPECWTRHLCPGNALKMALCVVNDDDNGLDLPPSKASIEVVGSNGERIASTSAEFPTVRYYTNAWKEIAVSLPQNMPAGDYVVKCRLTSGSDVVSANSFGISVMQPVKADKECLPESVMLYDPSGKTAQVFKDAGITFRILADLKELPRSGVVIVGEDALKAGTVPQKDGLISFLNSGGRMLCLDQDWASCGCDWLPVSLAVESRRSSGYTYIHPIAGNPIIFNGISGRDLRFWNECRRFPEGNPDVYPVLSPLRFTSAKEMRSTRVWASCGRMLSSAAIMEIYHGSGSIILSQFRCIRFAGCDPIARKLLLNLVSYAASSDHHGLLDLTKLVEWGPDAFRSGIFATHLQGLYPHSATYQHTGSSKGRLGEDHSIDGFTLVGDYHFSNTNWLQPVPDPAAEGWGVFYGRLSKPVTSFTLKARNAGGSLAKIKLRVDSKDIGSPQTIPPGEDITLIWNCAHEAGPVEVELRGDQSVVLKEICFN